MASISGGVWPAMLTPLLDDRPNHEQIERLVEVFVDQKLGGIYSVGSTGQWPLLAHSVRQEVAELTVQAAAGRIPVIVHVGAAATADAVDLAKHAERIGADGVSAVAPIYYSWTADEVFEHYRRIGAATSLPMYVYHLSSVSNVSLDPREYARRVLDLPNIAGMKITDHDLYPFGLISSVAGERLSLFSGADPLICHAALSGACGAIGTFYNLWGGPAQAARAAFVAGDFECGRRFTKLLQDAIADVFQHGSLWTFLQAAMKLAHKVDIGSPRAPLAACDRPWEPSEVERIVASVTQPN